MDAKKLKVSEKEVIDEIAAVRRERHKVSSRKRQITTS